MSVSLFGLGPWLGEVWGRVDPGGSVGVLSFPLSVLPHSTTLHILCYSAYTIFVTVEADLRVFPEQLALPCQIRGGSMFRGEELVRNAVDDLRTCRVKTDE